MRAEYAKEWASKKAEKPCSASVPKIPPPKKRKIILPELEERQSEHQLAY
jgi:hypothetical protein